jgi:hypothetical protein
MFPELLVTLALLGLSLLLGATAYESVVMAPNYEGDLPSTPANYFRVVAPATLVLLLVGFLCTLAALLALARHAPV